MSETNATKMTILEDLRAFLNQNLGPVKWSLSRLEHTIRLRRARTFLLLKHGRLFDL